MHLPKPLIAALLLVCAVAAQDERPGLQLREVAGEPRSLGELRGKIVVLNFWATWCSPCKEEMPMLAAAARRYAASGVAVIGANADEPATSANIPKFLSDTRASFPIWTGATTADMERFGLGTALPATAILDREGRVAFRILGPLTASELRERIEYLLRPENKTAPERRLDNIEKALREHEEETGHQHGSVSLEGASSVPS